MENYYDLLEVKKDASEKEIKNAYRKKIRLFHPDVNKSKEAEKIAKALNQAYHILSDPVKRQEYDFQTNFVHIPKQDYTKTYKAPQEYWEDISNAYKEAQRQQEALRRNKAKWSYAGKKQPKAQKVRVPAGDGYYDIEFEP